MIKKLSINKKYIAQNIVSQALFGGGTIAILLACSHYSSTFVFGRIASTFLVINLLLGVVMLWITAKWRDGASLSEKSQSIPHLEVLIVGIIPGVIAGGVAVYTYDAFFFQGERYPFLLGGACLSSAIYAAIRRNSLLNGNTCSVMAFDAIRFGIIIAFIIYWAKYGADFRLFCWCLIAAGILPLAMFRLRRIVLFVPNLITFLANQSPTIPKLFEVFTASRESSSIFFAGILSTISSQIIALMVPAIVNADSVGVVRVYEMLFFPLFFGIQSIDPLVSRKMVLLGSDGNKSQQMRLARLASLAVASVFLTFILVVYICDFSVYSLGIFIPTRYNEYSVLLLYIVGIGATISMSVGWRWIGLGWHTSLNLQLGTSYALVIAVLMMSLAKYFEYPLVGIFASRFLYEIILLVFLSQAGRAFKT